MDDLFTYNIVYQKRILNRLWETHLYSDREIYVQSTISFILPLGTPTTILLSYVYMYHTLMSTKTTYDCHWLTLTVRVNIPGWLLS